MSVKFYEYDSEAVRREARKFKKCCEQLDDSAIPRVKRIRADLEGNFEGETADALDGRLAEMANQIASLRGGCYSMYSTLMSYADALERADEKVAEMLSH